MTTSFASYRPEILPAIGPSLRLFRETVLPDIGVSFRLYNIRSVLSTGLLMVFM
jgi:hypothetical protein